MDTVKLVKKVAYGNIRFYPQCELGKALLKLKPFKKSFTKNDLKILRRVVNLEIYIEEGNKLIKIE